QALGSNVMTANYRAWIARYPRQSSLYAALLSHLLQQKNFNAATALVGEYNRVFPSETVFTIKARALIDYRKGSAEQGLAVYDQAFDPLWPQELVRGYFDLLRETHSLRKFLDRARATLNANPDDLN